MTATTETRPAAQPPIEQPLGERLFTWGDVAEHRTSDDAWIVIKGRVYDVTKFAKLHPGGDIILTAAGQDATDVFAGFHAATNAWSLLAPLCIGIIADINVNHPPNMPSVSYVADVQAMRQALQKLHAFDSSKLYYLAKFLSTTLFLLVSVGILVNFPSNPLMVLASAVIMATFWQQCGWLAHDFLHHQVFDNRGLGNIAGLIIGNIYQGFSVNWWKNKHNHHHAVPNVTDAPSGGDPDIATIPVLFWSEKLFEGEDLDKFPKWMLKNQSVLYFPILCMARFSWLMQSAQYQLEAVNPHVTSSLMYATEVSCLAIHHLAYLYLLTYIRSFPLLVMFVLVSQSLGGLFIGLVFTVGHNAMEVFTEDEMRKLDYIRLQVATTRDVTPHWFTDWFCGGLNYQVEHHIWPTIPRHNLPKAAALLQSFCKKYSITYSVESLIEGNRQVCEHLANLSFKAKSL